MTFIPGSCTCNIVWNSVLPPPPCPVHTPRCCGFGCTCQPIYSPPVVQYDLDDTQPIDLMSYPPYLFELRQLAKEPDE